MEAKKKVALIIGLVIFLFAAGRFVYAQVTENLSVSATVVPATLELSGFTLPNSLVTISNYGTPLGTTTSAADGTWSRTFSPLTPGTYEVTVFSTDASSTDTEAKTFNFTIVQNQVITYDNIILPPTMYATTPTFNQAQTGIVTAYGKPNTTMYLVINGPTTQTLNTTTNTAGKALFNINGGGFSSGTYDIYTYFEVSYPSDSLTIDIEPGPTATPTPTPTETPIPTSTPIATPTPIEVTGGIGPSATPAPQPTTGAGTTTPAVSPTPACTFPFNLLCQSDTNENGRLDINEDWDSIIVALTGNAFDINSDGETNSLDLSIFLSNITSPASTLNIYHVSPVENDGLCTMTLSNPVNYTGIILAVFGIVSFLLISRIVIHSFGGASGYSLTQIFGIALLLISAYFIYQTQNLQKLDQRFSDISNTRTQEEQLQQTIHYDSLISSEGKNMNTVDLYLSFNSDNMKLKTIDLTESFASIITKVEYSNKCGKIHIVGGIPKPATTIERELFVRNIFTIVKTNADTSLVTFPGTRAFEIDDIKETNQFLPRVDNLRFNN